MRLIHALREFNYESNVDIRAIALHTAAERRAMFVREADEAVCLDDLRTDGADLSPYLDHGVLERALTEARADAVWPGWGFVAEQAAFAALCDRLGVTFIGPEAEVMRRLGDKISAKRLAEEAGVPVAPWSGGPVESVEDAHRHAAGIGYPLVIKATSGGGGRGIRLVRSGADLPAAFDSARAEARKAFGDPTVFMERQITDARHVEVQVIGDELRDRVGDRGARLLDPAPQPEGDRGVPVDRARRGPGAGPVRGGRAALRPRRLPQRGHGGVPLRAGRARLRLPRGQHQAAGGAPGDRGDDRARPGEAAAPRGPGRAPRRGAAGRLRPRHRGPAERRGPGPRLQPRRPAPSCSSPCPPARDCGWTRGWPRATSSRPSSTR